MTFLLTQTAFSRLRPHNQDLPLDLVDKFRLADHNLPLKTSSHQGFPWRLLAPKLLNSSISRHQDSPRSAGPPS